MDWMNMNMIVDIAFLVFTIAFVWKLRKIMKYSEILSLQVANLKRDLEDKQKNIDTKFEDKTKNLLRVSKVQANDMFVLKTLIEKNEITLIDVRDIRELWRDGTIENAKHIPRGMLEFWLDPASPYHKPEFNTDKKLILFCAGAWRSALAVKTLQDMGFENIAEMEGGFGAWKKRGALIEE